MRKPEKPLTTCDVVTLKTIDGGFNRVKDLTRAQRMSTPVLNDRGLIAWEMTDDEYRWVVTERGKTELFRQQHGEDR